MFGNSDGAKLGVVPRGWDVPDSMRQMKRAFDEANAKDFPKPLKFESLFKNLDAQAERDRADKPVEQEDDRAEIVYVNTLSVERIEQVSSDIDIANAMRKKRYLKGCEKETLAGCEKNAKRFWLEVDAFIDSFLGPLVKRTVHRLIYAFSRDSPLSLKEVDRGDKVLLFYVSDDDDDPYHLLRFASPLDDIQSKLVLLETLLDKFSSSEVFSYKR